MVRQLLQRNCTAGQVLPEVSSLARIGSTRTVTTVSHLGHFPGMQSSAEGVRGSIYHLFVSLAPINRRLNVTLGPVEFSQICVLINLLRHSE